MERFLFLGKEIIFVTILS